MSEPNNQAMQTSFTLAMLSSLAVMVPLAMLVYLLTGEWMRAQRVAWLCLVILPAIGLLYLWLRRGHTRQALFGICLLIWAGLSAQLLTAGSLVNPIMPMLLVLSVIGVQALDKVLSWLMPLLCTGSIVSMMMFDRFAPGMLPQKVPPTPFGLGLGALLAVVFLLLLTRISSRHLAEFHQRDVERNDQLERLSGQLYLAIEAGKISYFSVDPQRLLMTFSEESKLLDCAAGEWPLDQLEVLSAGDRQRLAGALEHFKQQGRFPSLDVQLIAGPSKDNWYRLYASPNPQMKGRLICAMQDIHEQKQAELAKENFAAMVSHELRTPLTALLGALRLLQGLHGQNLTADAQQLLQMALRGGERLAVLVNDVLDYFRLQAGRMPVECELQAVGPMLHSAVDAVQALLQERDLQLQLQGDMTAVAWLDSQRGGQVLINLLSNAIKFSPPSSHIVLSVQSHAGQVRIALRDSGPGIDEEFSKRIFEPFSQASAGDTRDSNSTGLGLAISRQLMRQMAGELSYSSLAGEGATFYMDFILQPTAQTISA